MSRTAGWAMLAAIGVLAGAGRGVAATYYYVATNGSDAAAGAGWDTALRTISNGLAKALGAGDIVLVSNGTYVLSNQLVLSRGVVLTSVNGRAETILDGNYPFTTNRCVWISHPDAVVAGFTLTNGNTKGDRTTYTNWGGGAFVLYGTLRDCDVRFNASAHYGAGVCVVGGLVSNCVLADNLSTNTTYAYGGGGYVISNGAVWNCAISNHAMNYGGGLYLSGSSNTVAQCTIASNYAPYGGGMYVQGGTSTIAACVVQGNRAPSYGGGIYLYGGRSQVRDSTLASNTVAAGGGGLYFYEGYTAVASNCLITCNSGGGAGPGAGVQMRYGGSLYDSTVSYNAATGAAGGLFLNPYGVVSNCLVLGNTAHGIGNNRGGGGMYINETGMVENCVFRENVSTNAAAALLWYGGVMRNCLVADNVSTGANSGGALYHYYLAGREIRVENCTIVSNRSAGSAGGIYISSTAGMTNVVLNSIVYFNSGAGGYSNWYATGGTLIFSNNCALPSMAAYGGGNITSNPAVADRENGNYRLSGDSPCIDAGLTLPWMVGGGVDLDGRPRPDRFLGRADIGAYEFIRAGSLIGLR